MYSCKFCCHLRFCFVLFLFLINPFFKFLSPLSPCLSAPGLLSSSELVGGERTWLRTWPCQRAQSRLKRAQDITDPFSRHRESVPCNRLTCSDFDLITCSTRAAAVNYSLMQFFLCVGGPAWPACESKGVLDSSVLWKARLTVVFWSRQTGLHSEQITPSWWTEKKKTLKIKLWHICFLKTHFKSHRVL